MDYSKDQLVEALYAAADRYHIDRTIAYNQINQESRFNAQAVSSAGAKGIAQFMDATARDVGLYNPFDPIASLEAWGKYMHGLLGRFGDDYAKVLAAYNWGQGNVVIMITRFGADWLAHAPKETRDYVRIILGAVPTEPISTDNSEGGGGSGMPSTPSSGDYWRNFDPITGDWITGESDLESTVPWITIGLIGLAVIAFLFLSDD